MQAIKEDAMQVIKEDSMQFCIKCIAIIIAFVFMAPVIGKAAEQRGLQVRGALGVVSGIDGEVGLVEQGRSEVKPLAFQSRIKAQDHITTSAQGYAEILLENAILVTLQQDSTIVVRSKDTVELRQGSVDIALPEGRLPQGETFHILTPHAILEAQHALVSIQTVVEPSASLDSTVYAVAHRPRSSGDVIYVREGTVQLRNAASQVKSTVQHGHGVSVLGASTFHSEMIPIQERPLLASRLDRETSPSAQSQIMELHRKHVVALSEVVLRGSKGGGTADASTTVASSTAPPIVNAGYVSTSSAMTSGAGAGLLTASALPGVSLGQSGVSSSPSLAPPGFAPPSVGGFGSQSPVGGSGGQVPIILSTGGSGSGGSQFFTAPGSGSVVLPTTGTGSGGNQKPTQQKVIRSLDVSAAALNAIRK